MSASLTQVLFHSEGLIDRSIVLLAMKFIRKMNGGAQSILVQCQNGQYYVVKMTNNPQGPNVLANELLGSTLAASVGLPVPQSVPIYLSDDFIDHNYDLWFDLGPGRSRPDAGLHFGSRLVGEPSGRNRPVEYISRSKIEAIANRDAFLGMYLMDLWANNQDNRQAILINNLDERTQKVFFIDHGHMFGGPDGRFKERPGAATHLEISVYTMLWSPEIVTRWISRFEKIIPSVLSETISKVLPKWHNWNLEVLEEVLLRRLQNLPQLVELDAKEPHHFVHRKFGNELLRLPSSGICALGAAM